MTFIDVLPSREARTQIPRALRRFRAEGVTAAPVVFGAHRRPEAVVIPFELYKALLPAIAEFTQNRSEKLARTDPPRAFLGEPDTVEDSVTRGTAPAG